jgi:hypothetical protein
MISLAMLMSASFIISRLVFKLALPHSLARFHNGLDHHHQQGNNPRKYKQTQTQHHQLT